MASSIRRRYACMTLVASFLATACVQFPDLDAVETVGLADAPFPALVPLDPILAVPARPVDSADVVAVDARVATLEARAARLSAGQPVGERDLSRRVSALEARAQVLRDGN